MTSSGYELDGWMDCRTRRQRGERDGRGPPAAARPNLSIDLVISLSARGERAISNRWGWADGSDDDRDGGREIRIGVNVARRGVACGAVCCLFFATGGGRGLQLWPSFLPPPILYWFVSFSLVVQHLS